MKMKKILLGLGTVLTIVGPLINIVSCEGSSKNKYKGNFSSLTNKNTFLKINNNVPSGRFKDENKLTSVSLPKVKEIGKKAFQNSKLTSLWLPSVETIDSESFCESNLTSLSLPKVKKIGSWAFENSPISFLSLPDVEEIEINAFKNLKATSIELPKIKKLCPLAFVSIPLTNLYLPKINSFSFITEFVEQKPGFLLLNSKDTKVTLPLKFRTPKSLSKIFAEPIDKVTFTWV